MATPQTTLGISGRLAVGVLEWLIGSDKLGSADLCLVRSVPGLDEIGLPDEIVLSTGRRWRMTQAEGDFELRMRLVEAEDQPLFVYTSVDESHFGADLRERAALRYVIRPLARHTFHALIGADASTLDDDRFSQALRDVIAGGRRSQLLAAIRQRTWGNVVREGDAASILVEASFGFNDRYVESRSGELYARWLREPPLSTPSLFGLAIAILRQRYPLYADLLESTPDRSPVTAFREAARHDRKHDEEIVRLARDAGRVLLSADPQRLEVILADAERAFIAAGSPVGGNPLLRGAYQTRERVLVQQAASNSPPSTDEIQSIQLYLYSESRVRDALVVLARVGRGLNAIERAPTSVSLASDARMFREQIAWLDRAVRRLREAHFDDAECSAVAGRLVDRWYALRDTLNLAFASRLSDAWPGLFAKPGDGAPLVVSQVLKHVVRPSLVAGRNVFLIVLDGCDVPTFLEIVEALRGVGVPIPKLDAILSAVPSVTSHARRAIFAGKIPKDGLVEGGTVVDPSGDRKAFEESNSFLHGFTRMLFLKGDLGDDGAALTQALDTKEVAFIAAVFNDVDDAIASKEHGVLPERTIERCTVAFRRAVIKAIDNGWDVILTADHGHTPYRAPDVKLSLAHPRYAEVGPQEAAPAATVLFELATGSPYRIAAAYQLGAHAGPQHVGYHGGVSMEEMFVPLARFDRAVNARLDVPKWWDDAEGTEVAPIRIAQFPSVRTVPSHATEAVSSPVAPGRVDGSVTALVVACRTALEGDLRLLQIFERIREGAPSLSASQLGALVGIPGLRLRPLVTGLNDKLANAGIDSPIAIENDPTVFRWRAGS